MSTEMNGMNELAELQLAHNAWAIEELLDAAAARPAEQWRSPFPSGPGSIERALAHLIDCMDFFADAFAGRHYHERADFEEGQFEPGELRVHLHRADTELRRAVRNAIGVGGTIEFPPGSGRHASLTVALTQVFDHGTHHRAQVAWMLRRLDGPAPPETHPLRFAGLDDGD